MKLRIFAQLSLAFAIPLVLLASLATTAFYNIESMHDAQLQMVRQTSLRGVARETELQAVNERYAARSYVLTLKKSALAAMRRAETRAYASLHDFDQRTAGSPMHANADAAAGAVNSIFEASHAIVAFAKTDRDTVLLAYRGTKNDRTSSIAPTIVQSDRRTADLSKLMLKIRDTQRIASEKTSADYERRYAQAKSGIIALSIAALLLTAGVAFGIARWLRNRLNRIRHALTAIVTEDLSGLSSVISQLSQGDLTGRYTSVREPLPLRGADEITHLSSAYNELAVRLRTIGEELGEGMGRLSSLVANVTTASKHMGLSSEHLTVACGEASRAVAHIGDAVGRVAESAQVQAERINDAGAAIEQLARSSSQIAAGAHDQAQALDGALDAVRSVDREVGEISGEGSSLANAAKNADSEAVAGAEGVKAAAAAMHRLQEDTLRAVRAMATLEERSAAIGEIVATIDQIADQTNLLALNAAIEAARAGDHGRGFGVVADEIRKLAERSAKATREIAQILSAIRTETVSAADAMRSANESTADGLAVSERASGAIVTISATIGQTSRVADALAARSESMRKSSAVVTDRMTSISSVVGQNAAAASEVRSTTNTIAAAVIPMRTSAEEQSRDAQTTAASIAEVAAGLEQTDATATELAHQARTLNEIVDTFKIRETTDHADIAPAQPSAKVEEERSELLAVG